MCQAAFPNNRLPPSQLLRSARRRWLRDRTGHCHCRGGGWTPPSVIWRWREEGSETRGETWLGCAPAQALPTMMLNGGKKKRKKEREIFNFTHKEVISPSKPFTVFEIAAKWLTAAAAWLHYASSSNCTLFLNCAFPKLVFLVTNNFIPVNNSRALSVSSTGFLFPGKVNRTDLRQALCQLLDITKTVLPTGQSGRLNVPKAGSSSNPPAALKGTLTPCVSCMLGLSYGVMQVSALEERKKKKKTYAGMQGRGHFSMQQGAIMQNLSTFDKDKGEVGVKGKRLTPRYRQRGQLCRCIGGYCYYCSQILLSPVCVWWMNHLAIGQAGFYVSTTNRLPLHCVSMALPFQDQRGREPVDCHPSAHSSVK